MSEAAPGTTEVPIVDEGSGRSSGRVGRMVPPFVMLATLLAGLILPLRNSRIFYFWDDTAAAAAGVWQKVGESVLQGQFPVLVLEMWRGGNLAAEAATGMWNPVMLGLMVATHPLDDFALAITLSKFVLFALLAIGTFLLARDYGARPWMAAAAGVALPMSGYTLYTDGSAWINGLAVTAFTPLAWWAARRFVRRSGSPLVAVFFGYLLVSTGNPYSLLALLVVAIALAIELLVIREARRLVPLALEMLSPVLLAAIVYLPFVLSSSVTGRADQSTMNNEFLAPGLSDFLGISAPSFQPYIQGFGASFLPTPAMYLAWFVLPLLPWLRWRSAFSRWREMTGLFAFGIAFLLLVLGPSQAWMFRMPIRLVPLVLLAVIVLFAVVSSHGVATGKLWQRFAASSALIFVGFWQSWADRPELIAWHAWGALVVLALTGVFVLVRASERARFAVLGAGMLVVLALQTFWMPINGGFYNFGFPHSRSELKETFASNSDGMLFQIANLAVTQPSDMTPDRAWSEMAFGNNYSIADVETMTAYSGIGFTSTDELLCMTYYGGTCPEAWETLWTVPEGETSTVADLLRVQTVVVQLALAGRHDAPAGWELTDEGEFTQTFKRTEPLPELGGRLTEIGDDVLAAEVADATDTLESVVLSSGAGDDREVTFTRLAWPGYRATIDGAPLSIGQNALGLLTVEVPPGLEDAELRIEFTPPGWSLGIGLAIVGGLLALGLQLFGRYDRKRHIRIEGATR